MLLSLMDYENSKPELTQDTTSESSPLKVTQGGIQGSNLNQENSTILGSLVTEVPAPMKDKYELIKEQILAYHEHFELTQLVDEALIDELVYNYKLADDAKADIDARGHMINVVRNPEKDPYYQANPSVNIYYTAMKMITNLCSKLGISPDARKKLGLMKVKEEKPEPEKDPLDDFLS